MRPWRSSASTWRSRGASAGSCADADGRISRHRGGQGRDTRRAGHRRDQRRPVRLRRGLAAPPPRRRRAVAGDRRAATCRSSWPWRARTVGRVAALEVADDGTLLGINDRVQLADAEVEMRLRINEAHMRAGVTILDPASTFIDASVEHRRGRHHRARRGAAGPPRSSSATRSSAPAARCSTRTSASGPSSGPASSKASVVEADVTIGPFSHVRGGAHIGSGVELGNYAEVKNSVLGRRHEEPPLQLPRRRGCGRTREHRGGHHHRQLRRRAQAPHPHRGRVPSSARTPSCARPSASARTP